MFLQSDNENDESKCFINGDEIDKEKLEFKRVNLHKQIFDNSELKTIF